MNKPRTGLKGKNISLLFFVFLLKCSGNINKIGHFACGIKPMQSDGYYFANEIVVFSF